MKPNRSRSTVLCGLPLALLLVLGSVGLWLTFGLYAAPVPARKPAAYPAWWFQREVIPPKDATKASTTYPGDYPPAADYAVLTQGQLKHLATAAFDELQAHLPGGAGPAVTELVKGWYVLDGDAFHLDAQGHRVALASPQTNDFAPATHGQLKEVAHYFFDRLQAELYYPTDQPYPWDTPGAKPPADNAVANLGQAKNLFQFDLTTDTSGDGIPDWWKRAHGLPTTTPVANTLAKDGHLTNFAAFKQNLNPSDPNPPAARSLAAGDPPVVITLGSASLDLSASTLPGLGSSTLITNGNFEEGAEHHKPDDSGLNIALLRKWYVGGTTGWKAITGFKADPLVSGTRANELQVEVQQQLAGKSPYEIAPYVFPSGYESPPGTSRAGELNQYAELDAHWERRDKNGALMTNPDDQGISDRSQMADHGIKQTVNIERGNYLLSFDYYGRNAVDNTFSVWAEVEGNSPLIFENLILDKDADEISSGYWKRANVSFSLDGGDPTPGALLPIVLNFGISTTSADSYGAFIDNVILVPIIEKASIRDREFIVNVPDINSGATGTLDLIVRRQGSTDEVVLVTLSSQAPGRVTISLDDIMNHDPSPLDGHDTIQYDRVAVRWRTGMIDTTWGDKKLDVYSVEVLSRRRVSNYFSPTWGGQWGGNTRNKGVYPAGNFPNGLQNVARKTEFLNALDPQNEGLAMDGNSVIRDHIQPKQQGFERVIYLNQNDRGYIEKPDRDQDNASSPTLQLLRATSVAVRTNADRLTYDDEVYVPGFAVKTVDDSGTLSGNTDQIDVWRGQGSQALQTEVDNFGIMRRTCLKIINPPSP